MNFFSVSYFFIFSKSCENEPSLSFYRKFFNYVPYNELLNFVKSPMEEIKLKMTFPRPQDSDMTVVHIWKLTSWHHLTMEKVSCSHKKVHKSTFLTNNPLSCSLNKKMAAILYTLIQTLLEIFVHMSSSSRKSNFVPHTVTKWCFNTVCHQSSSIHTLSWSKFLHCSASKMCSGVLHTPY